MGVLAAGFVAFALFCFVAAVALPATTILAAFAAATGVAVLTQAVMLSRPPRGEVVRSPA